MAASGTSIWNTFPTVADVMRHPAFPTATWTLEPTSSGHLPVADGRGGPFNIAWEIHGDGPVRVVFIMGLGSFKSAWQRQTLHFGHEHGDKHSVLCLDNRGMGDSDVPLMRYSTSEMARDLVEVLEHIGWLPRGSLCCSSSASSPPPRHVTPPLPPSQSSSFSAASKRTLHIVGISMGGMIAQELACLIPDHISSLNLCCTAAAIENTTTFWENMVNRAQMLVPKSLENSVRSGARSLFPTAFLAAPDNAHLPVPKGTPGVRPPPGLEEDGGEYAMFGTNYERFVAQEMHKRLDPVRFTTKGFLLQLIAAGWHHKSPAQLAAMADRVGRERILVMHGTQDGMISVPHGRKLVEYLKPALGVIREGMGHAPPVECPEWFNGLIEKRIQAGEEMDGRM